MGYIVVHKKNQKCLLYTEEVVVDKNFKITNIHMTNTKQTISNKNFKIKTFLIFYNILLFDPTHGIK
jgi:hypothetical protein